MNVDAWNIAFAAIGGLGLFLYGMKMMSEGLQKSAGSQLRQIFEVLSTNRFAGVATGAAVTAIIQSSSATTVMVVGFVNAGLMTLTQAIHIIMGANIGTTITGWIITIKITKYALPMLGIGAGVAMFAKNDRARYIGEILLGFGMLFYGLDIMKHGFAPLKEMESFQHFFTRFGADSLGMLLLSILAGTAVTMILQSSSATIGITMTLASQGLLTFPAAGALVLGENIGTTITAFLAGIGSGVNARRSSRAHMLFNVFGVCYMVALFKLYVPLIEYIIPGQADFVNAAGEKPNIMEHIAAFHTMFNVINVIVFLQLTKLLEKAVIKIVPDREGQEEHLAYRGIDALATPALQLAQVKLELNRMADLVSDMCRIGWELIFAARDNSNGQIAALQNELIEKERHADMIQDEVIRFLAQVTKKGGLSASNADSVRSFTRIADELESVGDSAQFLGKVGWKNASEKVAFSDAAYDELREIYNGVHEVIVMTRECFNHPTHEKGERCDKRRREIRKMIKETRFNHMERFKRGECGVMQGMRFNNALNQSLALLGHLDNVVEASLGEK